MMRLVCEIQEAFKIAEMRDFALRMRISQPTCMCSTARAKVGHLGFVSYCRMVLMCAVDLL